MIMSMDDERSVPVSFEGLEAIFRDEVRMFEFDHGARLSRLCRHHGVPAYNSAPLVAIEIEDRLRMITDDDVTVQIWSRGRQAGIERRFTCGGFYPGDVLERDAVVIGVEPVEGGLQWTTVLIAGAAGMIFNFELTAVIDGHTFLCRAVMKLPEKPLS